VCECVDIDECERGLARCHYNADCINQPGSYVCVCEPGFTGDGVVCDGLYTLQHTACSVDKLLLSTANRKQVNALYTDAKYNRVQTAPVLGVGVS